MGRELDLLGCLPDPFLHTNILQGSNFKSGVVQLPGDSFSPALEAMIQVQGRTTAEMGGDKDGIVTTRLLVPTNQIGCLLGKGGSIIADMRRATRANIRILPKDTLPRCALESDELVQVSHGPPRLLLFLGPS